MIEKLKWMKGMTLSTLEKGYQFDVLEVEGNQVTLFLHQTGNEYIVFDKELKWAWDRLKSSGRITRAEIYDTGVRDSTYVVAILAQMEGVTVTRKSVTLHYLKP